MNDAANDTYKALLDRLRDGPGPVDDLEARHQQRMAGAVHAKLAAMFGWNKEKPPVDDGG